MAKKSAEKPAKSSAAPGPSASALKHTLTASGGILRLAPTWVPRSFLMPGRRLKLHPERPVRPGRQARRHRRTLVRLDHRRPPTKARRPMRA